MKSLSLPDFPSGSSINFYENRLYIVGDDAKAVLVLDSHYSQTANIHLFDFAEKRILKPLKLDFETSTVVSVGQEDYLIVLGSASLPNRTKGILIPLTKGKTESQIIAVDYQLFVNRLTDADLGEINIEGSTIIGNQFILSNRANRKNPVNNLIITESGFWNNSANASIHVCSLKLSMMPESVVGVSELCYVPTHDRLLMTFSTEATDNSYEDGAIGDSYLGWIDVVTNKIGRSLIELDGIINLSESNQAFKGEKIEGLCVESVTGNASVIHLVSDDDKGHSKLFKIIFYC